MVNHSLVDITTFLMPFLLDMRADVRTDVQQSDRKTYGHKTDQFLTNGMEKGRGEFATYQLFCCSIGAYLKPRGEGDFVFAINSTFISSMFVY